LCVRLSDPPVLVLFSHNIDTPVYVFPLVFVTSLRVSTPILFPLLRSPLPPLHLVCVRILDPPVLVFGLRTVNEEEKVVSTF
jgi:hypothetical protein